MYRLEQDVQIPGAAGRGAFNEFKFISRKQALPWLTIITVARGATIIAKVCIRTAVSAILGGCKNFDRTYLNFQKSKNSISIVAAISLQQKHAPIANMRNIQVF